MARRVATRGRCSVDSRARFEKEILGTPADTCLRQSGDVYSVPRQGAKVDLSSTFPLPRSVARVVIVCRRWSPLVAVAVVSRVEWHAKRVKRVVRHETRTHQARPRSSSRSPFRRHVWKSSSNSSRHDTRYSRQRGRAVRCVRVRKGKGGNKFTRGETGSIARCIVPGRTAMTMKTRRRRRGRGG